MVPVGAGLVRAAYSVVRYNNVRLNVAGLNPNPKSDQFALGYVYNLSKRTALYSTIAYVHNQDGAGLTVTGAPPFYTGTIAGSPGAAIPGKSSRVRRGHPPRLLISQAASGSKTPPRLSIDPDVIGRQSPPVAIPHGIEGRLDAPGVERRIEQGRCGAIPDQALAQMGESWR